MSNYKKVIEAAFADVEEVLRGKIRIEDGFSENEKLTYESKLRHSYAASVCEVILADVDKARIKHSVNAEMLDGERVSCADFKAMVLERIDASPLFKNFGEDGFFIQDFVKELIAGMPACDVPGVITCRECRNGQQCGEHGVVCKYTQDEYLPYEHFCARGERRTFGDEDNEE